MNDPKRDNQKPACSDVTRPYAGWDEDYVPDTCANCPDSSCCHAATDRFHGDYDDDPDGGFLDDAGHIEGPASDIDIKEILEGFDRKCEEVRKRNRNIAISLIVFAAVQTAAIIILKKRRKV